MRLRDIRYAERIEVSSRSRKVDNVEGVTSEEESLQIKPSREDKALTFNDPTFLSIVHWATPENGPGEIHACQSNILTLP